MDNLWKWEKSEPNLFSSANWVNTHDYIFVAVRELVSFIFLSKGSHHWQYNWICKLQITRGIVYLLLLRCASHYSKGSVYFNPFLIIILWDRSYYCSYIIDKKTEGGCLPKILQLVRREVVIQTKQSDFQAHALYQCLGKALQMLR